MPDMSETGRPILRELNPQDFDLYDLIRILGIDEKIQGISDSQHGDGQTVILKNYNSKSALALAWYTSVYSLKNDHLYPKSSPSLVIKRGLMEVSGQLGLHHEENGAHLVVDRVKHIAVTENDITFSGTVGKDHASLTLSRTEDHKITYVTWDSNDPGKIPDQEEEVRTLESGERLRRDQS